LSAFVKSSVCVLIPAYNEEKKIAHVVKGVREQGFEAVVVDDGSTDGTVAAVQNTGAHLIRSLVNEGKGAAIRKGFEWALNGNYAAMIMMDADGQHNPKELERFLEVLNADDADLVVGNRMQDPKGMSYVRRLTNRLMSWIISSVAGQPIPDTQCGYRAFTRKALQSMHLHSDRYEIESEMLMEAGRKELRIKSMPISSVYGDEISRIRPIPDTVRFFKFLFKFIFSRP
jgi:glycosyltransferase involved in cell wall biosynthesis